jgi:hypothetical protein
MNDQAILEQIALNPKCRAVQLADRLDLELVDVQATLVALAAAGDVTVSEGQAPNHQPCKEYDLSEKFRASERYEQLAAKVEIMAFRERHRTLGTAALAIAFIENRGSATSTELSVLLGLGADQYPSVELRSSVQGERLACNGRVWTLGPKAFPEKREPVAKPDSLESGAELGRVEKPTEASKFAEQNAGQPLRNPRQALREPVPVAVPQWRFAVWSDGQVEIQRNGEKVLSLPRDVANEFAGFMRGAA